MGLSSYWFIMNVFELDRILTSSFRVFSTQIDSEVGCTIVWPRCLRDVHVATRSRREESVAFGVAQGDNARERGSGDHKLTRWSSWSVINFLLSESQKPLWVCNAS